MIVCNYDRPSKNSSHKQQSRKRGRERLLKRIADNRAIKEIEKRLLKRITDNRAIKKAEKPQALFFFFTTDWSHTSCLEAEGSAPQRHGRISVSMQYNCVHANEGHPTHLTTTIDFIWIAFQFEKVSFFFLEFAKVKWFVREDVVTQSKKRKKNGLERNPNRVIVFRKGLCKMLLLIE